MTATRKLAAAGGVALLAGVALMITLHWSMHGTFAATAMGGPWAHHMTSTPGGMGWAMALGPVAMALGLAGIASLVIALIRSLAEAG
jgi:hypothetical protein